MQRLYFQTHFQGEIVIRHKKAFCHRSEAPYKLNFFVPEKSPSGKVGPARAGAMSSWQKKQQNTKTVSLYYKKNTTYWLVLQNKHLILYTRWPDFQAGVPAPAKQLFKTRQRGNSKKTSAKSTNGLIKIP
jgi:hypothetical protein